MYTKIIPKISMNIVWRLDWNDSDGDPSSESEGPLSGTWDNFTAMYLLLASK